jgi:hypothetical protein
MATRPAFRTALAIERPPPRAPPTWANLRGQRHAASQNLAPVRVNPRSGPRFPLGTASALALWVASPSVACRPRALGQSVLSRLVRDPLEAFLAQAAHDRDGEPFPRCVEREFRGFLGCGHLARAFERFHCGACGTGRLDACWCLPSTTIRNGTISGPNVPSSRRRLAMSHASLGRDRLWRDRIREHLAAGVTSASPSLSRGRQRNSCMRVSRAPSCECEKGVVRR